MSTTRMKVIHTDTEGFEHSCKLAEGDWVAYEFPQSFGEAKPGLVTRVLWSEEEDGWVVGISFRFAAGDKTLHFGPSVPLTRIRWVRQGGRSRWAYL